MRKNEIEDDGIKGILRDEYNRCLELLDQVRRAMTNYPHGKLVVKKVKVKERIYEYYHLQWREGARVLSRHVPKREIPEFQKMIEEREAYRSNYLKLEKRLEYLAPLIGEKRPSKRKYVQKKRRVVRFCKEILKKVKLLPDGLPDPESSEEENSVWLLTGMPGFFLMR